MKALRFHPCHVSAISTPDIEYVCAGFQACEKACGKFNKKWWHDGILLGILCSNTIMSGFHALTNHKLPPLSARAADACSLENSSSSSVSVIPGIFFFPYDDDFFSLRLRLASS